MHWYFESEWLSGTSESEVWLSNWTVQSDLDTRLTHAFLPEGEDPAQCMFYKIPLSVKHILLDCPAFNVENSVMKWTHLKSL